MILGTPFLTQIYPFTVNCDGIHTNIMGTEIIFRFLSPIRHKEYIKAIFGFYMVFWISEYYKSFVLRFISSSCNSFTCFFNSFISDCKYFVSLVLILVDVSFEYLSNSLDMLKGSIIFNVFSSSNMISFNRSKYSFSASTQSGQSSSSADADADYDPYGGPLSQDPFDI